MTASRGAANLAVLGLCLAAAPVPAAAQLNSFLFGKPGTRSLSSGIFEVTARGNNMRERRSSLDMALIKAAKKAAKEKGAAFAVLRAKSGTWLMNGRPVGDETTLRFKLCAPGDTVLDDNGAPARVYAVAELLAPGLLKYDD